MNRKAKLSLVLILSAVLISVYCIAFLFNPDNNIDRVELIKRDGKTVSQVELAPAEKYTQSVYVYKDFSFIEIERVHTTEANSVKISIASEGVSVYSGELIFNEGDQTKELNFAARGGTYELTLENTGKKTVIFPLVSSSGYDIGNEKVSSNPVLKLGVGVRTNRVRILFLGCVVLLLFLSVSAVIFWLRGTKFTIRMTVFYIFIVAMVYTLVFPAWNINDYKVHFATAYHYSNKLLGVKDEDNTLFVRKDDTYYLRNVFSDRNQEFYQPTKRSYDDAIGLLFNKVSSDELEPITKEYRILGYRYWNFIPQIIGITAARIFSVNILAALLLSRLLSLAILLLGIYLALSRLPGNLTLPISFVFCFPVVAMCFTAVSYDAVSFVVTLNLIASVYNIQRRYSNGNAIALIICSYLLGAIKGGAYVLFGLLLFLIPLYRGKKEKWLLGFSVAAVLTALLIIYRGVVFGGGSFFQFGSDNTGFYSVRWAIAHPIEYLILAGRTYIRNPDIYYSMIGRDLGWNSAVLPCFACGMFGILLFVSILRNEKTAEMTWVLGKKDKRIVVLVILLTFLFTPAMLLSNTRIPSDTIFGIQGRYYIPVFFLGIVLLSGIKREFRGKKTDSFVLFTGMGILQSVSLYYMSVTFLLR